MSSVRLSLIVSGVVALAACGGGSGEATEASSPALGEVTVEFENTQFEDATLYVETSGSQRRLGRIGGSTAERFRVPYSPTGYVFVASFQAIGEFETDLIQADTGSTITITAQSTGSLIYSIR